MERVRILVVDDHPIVRQGIRSLLSNYDDLEVVAEAENGVQALAHLKHFEPDIILLDIKMPHESGLDVLARIRETQPEARVLMLTSFDENEYVMGALRAGAQGFVLKSVSDEVLVDAIRKAHQGERVLSPQITEQVVRFALTEPVPVEEEPELTNDELKILHLIIDGLSNSQIADELYMSNTTVKRKLRKIFTKMDVQTRAQAAAQAVRRGLV